MEFKSSSQPRDRSAASLNRHQVPGFARFIGGAVVLLFSLPFLLFGCSLLFFGFFAPLFQSVVAAAWQAVGCTVDSSEPYGSGVKVVYTYEFDGQQYTSERYDFNLGIVKSSRWRQAVLDRYGPGRKSTCYVRPSDPTKAVINRRFVPSILGSFIGLFLLNCSLAVIKHARRTLRGHGDTSNRPGQFAPSRSSLTLSENGGWDGQSADERFGSSPPGGISIRRSGAGTTAIGLPAVGAVRGAGGWLAISVIALWTFVTFSMFVAVFHAALTDTFIEEEGYWPLLVAVPFLALIAFHLYVWHLGRQHAEIRVASGALTIRQSGPLGTGKQHWKSGEIANVRVVPVGRYSEVDGNGQQSRRAWQWHLEIVSTAGMSRKFFAHRDKAELEWIGRVLRNALSTRNQKSSTVNVPAVTDWLPAPDVDLGPNHGGPVTLRSDASPRTDFLHELIGALLCFGFVALTGRGTWNSVLAGRPEWNGVVFFALFTGMGLLLIGRAFRKFLAIYNPRPTLTMRAATVSLGDTVELEWNFSGNTAALRSLEIYLLGYEKSFALCRGRRREVSEAFAEIPIVKSEAGVPSGNASVTIPSDTMHSFEAENNGINWTLELVADVKLRPKIEVGFPIVVLPQRIMKKRSRNERVKA